MTKRDRGTLRQSDKPRISAVSTELDIDESVLVVTPAEAAQLLHTTTRWLRKYARMRPERLTKVRWGTRRIRYRMDQIRELARTGLI